MAHLKKSVHGLAFSPIVSVPATKRRLVHQGVACVQHTWHVHEDGMGRGVASPNLRHEYFQVPGKAALAPQHVHMGLMALLLIHMYMAAACRPSVCIVGHRSCDEFVFQDRLRSVEMFYVKHISVSGF